MCGTEPEILLSQRANLSEALSFIFKAVTQLLCMSSILRLAPMVGPRMLIFK